MKQEWINVLPNQFGFIDEDGEPQGVCPADPEHSGGQHMHIGASLDRVRTKIDLDEKEIRARWRGDTRSLPQTTKFVFVTEPVRIPVTAHYLARLREGSLVAADEQAHRKAFGAGSKFESPDVVLARHRAAAIDDYVAHYGEPPAFAVEEAEPSATAPADAPQEATTTTERAPAAPPVALLEAPVTTTADAHVAAPEGDPS